MEPLSNNIPESEVNWLYALPHKYRIQLGLGTIYPVDLLPPTLAKWVKQKDRDTEYINMGPSNMGKDGMVWAIWGWKALPTESFPKNEDWHDTIHAIHT